MGGERLNDAPEFRSYGDVQRTEIPSSDRGKSNPLNTILIVEHSARLKGLQVRSQLHDELFGHALNRRDLIGG